MADISGIVKKQVTLTAGVVQRITFPPGSSILDLALMGSGVVAFDTEKAPASVTDDTCNFLNDDVPVYQFVRIYGFTQLYLLSDTNVTAQWSVR